MRTSIGSGSMSPLTMMPGLISLTFNWILLQGSVRRMNARIVSLQPLGAMSLFKASL